MNDSTIAREIIINDLFRRILATEGQLRLLDLAWREFSLLVADTGKTDESFIEAALTRARRIIDEEDQSDEQPDD